MLQLIVGELNYAPLIVFFSFFDDSIFFLKFNNFVGLNAKTEIVTKYDQDGFMQKLAWLRI